MVDLATTIQTALSTQTTADERIECRIQGRMVACLGPQEIVDILNSIDPDQAPSPEFTSLIARIESGEIRLTQAATQTIEHLALQMGTIWPQGTANINAVPAGSSKKSSFTMEAVPPFARFLKDAGCSAEPRFYGYGNGLGINAVGCPDLLPAPRETDAPTPTTTGPNDPFSVLEDGDEFPMPLSPTVDTTKKLYINTSLEHYVMEMDEPTGIEQLVWLSDTAQVEESWAFVATTDQKFFWHEIGIEETAESVSMASSEIEEIGLLYGKYLQAVHFYHIHPKHPKRDQEEALRPESKCILSTEDWLNKPEFENSSVAIADFAVAAEGIWWADPGDTAIENIVGETASLYACLHALESISAEERWELITPMCSSGVPLLEYVRCTYLVCASKTTLQPKFYAGEMLDQIPVIIRPDDGIE